jgi:hypothetical protein
LENDMTRMLSLAICFATAAATLLTAPGAHAGNDSCREWQKEHCDWKARAIQRYLRGAPQRDLDEAIFEVLQREAYLTSCDASAQSSRNAMVGWRLVDRTPDEYGSAVLESVLERSGFDVGLRSRLSGVLAPPAQEPAPIANTAMHNSRRSRGPAGASR